MFLTDEQMAVVTGASPETWSDVPLFTGRQTLPPWIKDVHIDWMEEYANAPHIRFKVTGDLYRWPGQVWEKEGDAYFTKHEDGRMRVYYHNGAVSECGAWRTMLDSKQETYAWIFANCLPGETGNEAALRAANAHLENVNKFDPERASRRVLETRAVQATTKQGGFGGDCYFLTMKDGSEIGLRGPWSGGPLPGYVEVVTHDIEHAYHPTRQWYQNCGLAGLCVTEELFIKIISHYCPEIRLARINKGYGIRLEPYKAEWNMPKSFYLESKE